MSDSHRPDSARAALDQAREHERNAANRLKVPWWHDPLIGLLLAMIVVHHAMPTPFNLFLVTFGVLGVFLLLRHYTSQDVWVDGWRKGRTYPVSVAFVVIYLVIYFGGMALYHLADQVWAVPASALAVFLLTVVFGRVWLAVWRREVSGSP